MKKDVLAPSVGESITEVSILSWTKQSGETVKVGEIILEIESDKATVEVIAESDGVLEIIKDAGETVNIGEVVGKIDPSGKATTTSAPTGTATAQPSAPATPAPLSPSVRRAVMENQLSPAEIQGTGRGGRITNTDVDAHLHSRSTPSVTAPAIPKIQY